MAVLFSNGIAMKAVDARNAGTGAQALQYAAGAVLALVTLSQRDHPHWFGARIPDTPQRIEFVTVARDPGDNTYRSFGRAGPAEAAVSSEIATTRGKFLLGLSPA